MKKRRNTGRDDTGAHELTVKQKQELQDLESLPGEKIDTDEIAELPPELWRQRGIVGRFYRPIKKPVTLRLDADVIAWLKAEGPGYQTKANRLLRQRMMADLRRPGSRKSKVRKTSTAARAK